VIVTTIIIIIKNPQMTHVYAIPNTFDIKSNLSTLYNRYTKIIHAYSFIKNKKLVTLVPSSTSRHTYNYKRHVKGKKKEKGRENEAEMA
jgi:hypothetical protein